ncbi:MAG: putative manganese transporter [Firmicutes bacterium]|nr:putative manganese transporter [Bacillota bacterium]
MVADVVMDTLLDGIKLFPFLLITYLVMEYIEHKTSSKTQQIMKNAGKWGPIAGSILGVVPQCGFSAAASNLYAGRIITVGTLAAVFLSTSDEMLPILISEQVNPVTIIRILAVKVLIGMVIGFLLDLIIRRKKGTEKEEFRIEHMCDHEHCHCKEGKIFRSAFNHTLQIFIFILVISFLLNLLIGYVGEDKLAALISGKPVLGPMLSALIGLIPNCASSVVLTQLYLEGVLGAGAMIAGLLSGSGVGLLVLYRVNDDLKENLKITIMLYAVGVVFGILIEMLGIVF